MDIQNIINTIKDVGVTLVIVAYFLWKDARFNTTLEKTLQALVDSVDTLKEIVKDIDDTGK